MLLNASNDLLELGIVVDMTITILKQEEREAKEEYIQTITVVRISSATTVENVSAVLVG